ncbi:MAG: hypothetical protein ACP5SI_07840 [Chloroflexia bacterium]
MPASGGAAELLSGRGDIAQRYEAGANRCVVKPVVYDRLAKTVREVGHYWLRLNRAPNAPCGLERL